MKTKITYPLPLSYISDRHDEAVSFFQKKRPHKETFIDFYHSGQIHHSAF
mgnify:CR=1 FL=1